MQRQRERGSAHHGLDRRQVDMDPETGVGGDSMDTELALGNLLEVFFPGELKGRVRITEKQPLLGEIVRDARGRYFLVPEEDHRGAGMYWIPVHNLSAQDKSRYVEIFRPSPDHLVGPPEVHERNEAQSHRRDLRGRARFP